MAKQVIPARQVETCDLCNRESTSLTACLVCGREYCFLCEGLISGCIVMPDICRNCARHEPVAKTVLKFSPKIKAVFRLRDRAIKGLAKKVKGLAKHAIDEIDRGKV
jgi:hypothetical protein